uniref:Uncharacterized protein n=1 Tax=Populus trichocarpa TaxID=3694 RepID=A0A2K2AG73_POPTR
MRRGDETGEEVVLIGHERLEMGGRRGGGPRAGIAFCIRKHERSRAGQFGGSPLDWTRAPLLGSPRAPGEARGGEGQLHIRVPPKWVRSTGTPPRRKAPRGPWAESDGGSRPTVRCTSTEPADTDSPITAHATLRTRDNNPDERTTATRASRRANHGHESKISKGQATRRTRRISKGQATGRGGKRRGQSCGGLSAPARKTEARPRQQGRHATSRTRRISKGQGTGRGGKRRGQSCGGLSAPARKTEARGSGHRRRDVAASRRPRSSCQHLGTSTANECHAHAADKQPQRARRLGAGPEDGGRNRVVAGRKTGHRCRQYFGP